ncbi:hypothetical protein HOK68_03415, partial [Candidatus Woesearchaeota archaeon]|nr:hypothetical protein [Candidatus Woesearchaeota archaeon]
MNKKSILLLAILCFSTFFALNVSNDSINGLLSLKQSNYKELCIDTDGKDYYKIGFVDRDITSFSDTCNNDNVLTENVCNGQFANQITHTCIFSCDKSKCLKSYQGDYAIPEILINKFELIYSDEYNPKDINGEIKLKNNNVLKTEYGYINSVGELIYKNSGTSIKIFILNFKNEIDIKNYVRNVNLKDNFKLLNKENKLLVIDAIFEDRKLIYDFLIENTIFEKLNLEQSEVVFSNKVIENNNIINRVRQVWKPSSNSLMPKACDKLINENGNSACDHPSGQNIENIDCSEFKLNQQVKTIRNSAENNYMCKKINILSLKQNKWHLLGSIDPELNNKLKECNGKTTYSFNDGAWIKDSKKIELGKGFWIKLKESCSLEIESNNVINYKMESGWNLVSLKSILKDSYLRDNICLNGVEKILITNKYNENSNNFKEIDL